MQIASHNSWTFAPVKQWYLRPLAFMARCQRINIKEQLEQGVRSFDLRVRYNKDMFIMAHGIFKYNYTLPQLHDDLQTISNHSRTTQENISIRVIHEVRNKSQYTEDSRFYFSEFCFNLEYGYPSITFYGGNNLYNGEKDYQFKDDFSIEGKYSSVCPPKIDDLYPYLYARLNNHSNIQKGTTKDLLMIDFVDIK